MNSRSRLLCPRRLAPMSFPLSPRVCDLAASRHCHAHPPMAVARSEADLADISSPAHRLGARALTQRAPLLPRARVHAPPPHPLRPASTPASRSVPPVACLLLQQFLPAPFSQRSFPRTVSASLSNSLQTRSLPEASGTRPHDHRMVCLPTHFRLLLPGWLVFFHPYRGLSPQAVRVHLSTRLNRFQSHANRQPSAREQESHYTSCRYFFWTRAAFGSTTCNGADLGQHRCQQTTNYGDHYTPLVRPSHDFRDHHATTVRPPETPKNTTGKGPMHHWCGRPCGASTLIPNSAHAARAERMSRTHYATDNKNERALFSVRADPF